MEKAKKRKSTFRAKTFIFRGFAGFTSNSKVCLLKSLSQADEPRSSLSQQAQIDCFSKDIPRISIDLTLRSPFLAVYPPLV